MRENTGVKHRFKVGQLVRIRGPGRYVDGAAGPYEIIATLPERDSQYQYCVKSNREAYKRIVKEGELESDE
jgi:hypothetical protein